MARVITPAASSEDFQVPSSVLEVNLLERVGVVPSPAKHQPTGVRGSRPEQDNSDSGGAQDPQAKAGPPRPNRRGSSRPPRVSATSQAIMTMRADSATSGARRLLLDSS